MTRRKFDHNKVDDVVGGGVTGIRHTHETKKKRRMKRSQGGKDRVGVKECPGLECIQRLPSKHFPQSSTQLHVPRV